MAKLTPHEKAAAAQGIDPRALRNAAANILGSAVTTAPAETPNGDADQDRALSARLRVDVADPTTRWNGYGTAPLGAVTPRVTRSTKPGRQPTTQIERDIRENTLVGARGGEQLSVPGPRLTKPGMFVRPRTPEIRQGLAQGEGITLRFDQVEKPALTVVYFVDEKARRATLVRLHSDGSTKVSTITDKKLLPQGFTIGARAQIDQDVDAELSGLSLLSVEMEPGVGQRLGVIDAEGIPTSTTVADEDRRIHFARELSPADQARAVLAADLHNLPTAP